MNLRISERDTPAVRICLMNAFKPAFDVKKTFGFLPAGAVKTSRMNFSSSLRVGVLMPSIETIPCGLSFSLFEMMTANV